MLDEGDPEVPWEFLETKWTQMKDGVGPVTVWSLPKSLFNTDWLNTVKRGWFSIRSTDVSGGDGRGTGSRRVVVVLGPVAEYPGSTDSSEELSKPRFPNLTFWRRLIEWSKFNSRTRTTFVSFWEGRETSGKSPETRETPVPVTENRRRTQWVPESHPLDLHV